MSNLAFASSHSLTRLDEHRIVLPETKNDSEQHPDYPSALPADTSNLHKRSIQKDLPSLHWIPDNRLNESIDKDDSSLNHIPQATLIDTSIEQTNRVLATVNLMPRGSEVIVSEERYEQVPSIPSDSEVSQPPQASTTIKQNRISSRIDLIAPFDQNLQNPEAVEVLKHILSKHYGKRSTKEIHFIRKCLKNVKFFLDLEATLPEVLILRLCKFLAFEEYPQFHRLYKAGDYGRKFYIIVEGSVFVLTPTFSTTLTAQLTSNVKESNEIQQMISQGYDESSSPVLQPNHTHDTAEELKALASMSKEDQAKHIVTQRNEGFYIKKSLMQGDGFGEIALRTEGIRTASIVCKEQNTRFVSITASTYQEILEAHYEKLYKEKLDFLKSVSIFSRWSLAFIHEVMMQVQIKMLKRGEIVYDYGDRSTHLYFVRSGGVELQQVVEMEQQPQQQQQQQQQQQLQQQQRQSDMNCTSLREIPEKLIKTNSVWNERVKNSKLRKCSLVIIGPNQYFGDYEIFKKSKRIMRAVCCSNSELFVLEKKDFFESMHFVNIVKEVHSLFKEREIWYQTMIQTTKNTEISLQKQSVSLRQLPLVHETVPSITTQLPQSSVFISSSRSIQLPKYYQQQQQQLRMPSLTDTSQQQLLRQQENQLDSVQARNRARKQQQISEQIQTIESVLRMKQFMSKSINLLGSIESLKHSQTRSITSSTASISSENKVTSTPQQKSKQPFDTSSMNSKQSAKSASVFAEKKAMPMYPLQSSTQRMLFTEIENYPTNPRFISTKVSGSQTTSNKLSITDRFDFGSIQEIGSQTTKRETHFSKGMLNHSLSFIKDHTLAPRKTLQKVSSESQILPQRFSSESHETSKQDNQHQQQKYFLSKRANEAVMNTGKAGLQDTSLSIYANQNSNTADQFPPSKQDKGINSNLPPLTVNIRLMNNEVQFQKRLQGTKKRSSKVE